MYGGGYGGFNANSSAGYNNAPAPPPGFMYPQQPQQGQGTGPGYG